MKKNEFQMRIRYYEDKDMFVIETSTDSGKTFGFSTGFQCHQFEGETEKNAISYTFATTIRENLKLGYVMVK